jgi:hypothetical protein
MWKKFLSHPYKDLVFSKFFDRLLFFCLIQYFPTNWILKNQY